MDTANTNLVRQFIKIMGLYISPKNMMISNVGFSIKLRNMKNNKTYSIVAAFLALGLFSAPIYSCTGITLKSKDGAVVVARTVEWALGDDRPPIS